MKRIILTESQYKRLVRQKLNESIIYSDPKDEYDATPKIRKYLGTLSQNLTLKYNVDLYVKKIEDGIVYLEMDKYNEEQKNYISNFIDRWVNDSVLTIKNDKKVGDYDYFSGNKWNYDDEEITDVEDTEEIVDVSDIKACKWGRKVVLPSDEDIQFYKDILKGIGANVTCEKMLFLFAWKKGESSKSTYNPFATTYKDEKNEGCYYNCLKDGSGFKPIGCRKCSEGTSPGVRNYKNKESGISATVNTMKLKYYPNILKKLQIDTITAIELANEIDELKTWGTGSLPKQILEKNTTIQPGEIAKIERVITKGSNDDKSKVRLKKVDNQISLPSNAKLTSLPQEKRWSRPHHGYDIVGPYSGNKCLIVCNKVGTVTYAKSCTGYGNIVEIKHSDGVYSAYAHLDKIYVEKGEKIKVGDVIGVEGNTGRSDGRHLHFEERVERPSGYRNRCGEGSPYNEVKGWDTVKPLSILDDYFYFQKGE